MAQVRRSVSGVAMTGVALVLVASAVALAAERGFEQDIALDKEPESNSTLISLGPIGARVHTDHRVETCADSQSSQGTVKYIFKNSLAAAKLQLEDVIVGVNGQDFNKDFSRKLAAEIDRAEGGSGRLVLNIQRGGKPLEVTFDLPKIGSYSSTFPYDCRKSELILEAACDWLARHQKKNGDLGGIECSAIGGLAFLGSGIPKYQENTTRVVKLILEHFKPEGKEWPYGVKKFGPGGYWPGHDLETWRLNYAAIFLSEYYLATGDASVLPTMDKLNKNISFRQFHYLPEDVKKAYVAKNNPLPPYWFGHQFPPAGGYGNLGVNVANALLAWELMAECGVAVDRDNFEKTRDYVQVAGPTGEMPYASAPNQRGGDGDAFGRTGVLAVAYHLCNDRDAFNGKIVAALRRLQRNNYFTSHASSDLGKAWGTLGLAALDPALFREAMDAHRYDYCLVRLSDGSFAANPAVHPQNAGNGDFGYGREWTTALNALIFTLSKQRLRITGSWGMPGVDQSSLSKSVRQVADLVRNGRYAEATKLAVRTASGSAASESDKRAAAGIQEYILRQGKRAATQLEKIRSGGDVYLLKMQIAEKKKTCAGIETFDGPAAAMESALDTEAARAELRVGAEFHRLADTWRKLSPTQAGPSREMLIRKLDDLANNHKGSVYERAARKAIEWFQEPGKAGDPFTVYFESGEHASK